MLKPVVLDRVNDAEGNYNGIEGNYAKRRKKQMSHSSLPVGEPPPTNVADPNLIGLLWRTTPEAVIYSLTCPVRSTLRIVFCAVRCHTR
jgi:hypothetical protein